MYPWSFGFIEPFGFIVIFPNFVSSSLKVKELISWNCQIIWKPLYSFRKREFSHTSCTLNWASWNDNMAASKQEGPTVSSHKCCWGAAMPFWTSHKKRQYSDTQRPSVSGRKRRSTCLLLALVTDIHRPVTPEEPLNGRLGWLLVFKESPSQLGEILGTDSTVLHPWAAALKALTA